MEQIFGALSLKVPEGFADHSKVFFVGPQVNGLPIGLSVVVGNCKTKESLKDVVSRDLDTMKKAAPDLEVKLERTEASWPTKGERREFVATVGGSRTYFQQYFFKRGAKYWVASVAHAERSRPQVCSHFDALASSLRLTEEKR